MHSKLPAAERFEKGIKRIDTLGGPQNVSVISESGLYRLIMRSKIGSAERFEKGVKRIATLGGPQNTSIISESGLYKLVMRSDKPEARTPLK